MKKWIYASTSDVSQQVVIDKDGEEWIMQDLYYSVADYVNDSDYMWEYNTPESFGYAIITRIKDRYGIDLTDKQEDFIMEQASYGDFDAFDEMFPGT